MATGTVKTLSDRGFGFITPDAGQGDRFFHQEGDIFFHQTALVEVSIDQLRRGDRLTYSTEPGTRGRGLRAVDVRRAE
jgi:CspA family cold shock protein